MSLKKEALENFNSLQEHFKKHRVLAEKFNKSFENKTNVYVYVARKSYSEHLDKKYIGVVFSNEELEIDQNKMLEIKIENYKIGKFIDKNEDFNCFCYKIEKNQLSKIQLNDISTLMIEKINLAKTEDCSISNQIEILDALSCDVLNVSLNNVSFNRLNNKYKISLLLNKKNKVYLLINEEKEKGVCLFECENNFSESGLSFVSNVYFSSEEEKKNFVRFSKSNMKIEDKDLTSNFMEHLKIDHEIFE